MYIKLLTIENVKEFVDLALRYDADVTVTTTKYKVDGKSILGILSLDLAELMYIDFKEQDSDKRREFYLSISKWMPDD